jgi:nudix-type nucleoside diphosphatase (YffH/AdpP family)
MPRKVDIISRRNVFSRFIFRVEEARLRHEKYDGTMSKELLRLNLDRGDAVAAIIHNTTDDTILLTEQFRYPTHAATGGWLAEIPAGMIRKGEEPAAAMRRELVEEIGYEVDVLHEISAFFLSPGGSSERIFLFYAAVHPTDKTSEGGGVAGEGEDIRTLAVPVDDLQQGLLDNAYPDAKTILAMQWVLMHRDQLGSLS